MGDLANAVSTGITPTTLFGAITPFAPVIITALTVGFSLMIARHVIGGLGRGKAKI